MLTDEKTVDDLPLTLIADKAEARVDSRVLASRLGSRHQSAMELMKDHRADFEELGILRFQTGVIRGRGQPERFALLNEDQCYLLLTYSRNTAKVRHLKVRLVKAFRDARRAAEDRKAEYLPTYHALHDQIHALAAKSANERFVHMNVNKLINKAAGLDAGQRMTVALPQQSLLVVAQAVAARALRGARDHHDGYCRAKDALLALSAVTSLGVE
jgi:phage regulator Rha-like protein